MEYTVEMTSGGMTHTKLQDNWLRHSSNIKILPQQFERLQGWYY
jgi:hypothetical protein